MNSTEFEASPEPSTTNDGEVELEARPGPSTSNDGEVELEASPEPSTTISMSTTNGEVEPVGNEVHFSAHVLVQSALTTLVLAIINALTMELAFWTDHAARIVQTAWMGLIQASYLSIDVLRFTFVEVISLVTNGCPPASPIFALFKTSIVLIINIFRGAYQVLRDFIKGPIHLPSEALIQEVLEVDDVIDGVDNIQDDMEDEEQSDDIKVDGIIYL